MVYGPVVEVFSQLEMFAITKGRMPRRCDLALTGWGTEQSAKFSLGRPPLGTVYLRAAHRRYFGQVVLSGRGSILGR
jgi:hypothetical protein